MYIDKCKFVYMTHIYIMYEQRKSVCVCDATTGKQSTKFV